jgi:probable F420-dependent oxidoreductase
MHKETPMKIGVVFPQTEIGNDPEAIRDWAVAVEDMGYTHILAYDHVLGANRDRHRDLGGPYGHHHAFHEPFVLFGFLAGAVARVEFATGIIILPQRQTALVAKQAAAVDVLSRGRLRLGVAVGWNHVEYEALGLDFHTRGRRIEEQIEILRALWTNELVTRELREHRITDAGINPLPVQRPIPVWMGGNSDAVMRRATRIADGWIWSFGSGHLRPGDQAQATVNRAHELVAAGGRDPSAFGIEGRMALARIAPDQWGDELSAWRRMHGVTHLCVDTMGMGLTKPDQHIDVLRRLKEATAIAR